MRTRTHGISQNPAREREKDLFKIQQERERRTYSKSSKREREGLTQNPAKEREKDLLKIQQEFRANGSNGVGLETRSRGRRIRRRTESEEEIEEEKRRMECRDMQRKEELCVEERCSCCGGAGGSW